MEDPIHLNTIDFDTEMLEAMSVFHKTLQSLWSLLWIGTGRDLEAVPL